MKDIPGIKELADVTKGGLCAKPENFEVFNISAEEDSPPEAVFRAKAICKKCPVKNPCLDVALSIPTVEMQGVVLGGLTGVERDAIQRRQKITSSALRHS
jgi:hypothetical protein